MVKLTYSILCKIKKTVNAHNYFYLFITRDNIVSHVNLFPKMSRPIKVLPTVVDCALFSKEKEQSLLVPYIRWKSLACVFKVLSEKSSPILIKHSMAWALVFIIGMLSHAWTRMFSIFQLLSSLLSYCHSTPSLVHCSLCKNFLCTMCSNCRYFWPILEKVDIYKFVHQTFAWFRNMFDTVLPRCIANICSGQI